MFTGMKKRGQVLTPVRVRVPPYVIMRLSLCSRLVLSALLSCAAVLASLLALGLLAAQRAPDCVGGHDRLAIRAPVPVGNYPKRRRV